jgi:glycosyltransferase involved in cell wall biosynthesis
MSEPLVTVVTPVYNGEQFLPQCIESVLAQKHGHFEYLICNNHSTDRSGEIADGYARKDPRIRVVKPPTFLPQVQNFNFAVRQMSAQSSYLKLVFADDWVFPEALSRMLEIAERNPTVALVGAYRIIETTPFGFGLSVDQDVFPGREACRAHLLGKAYPFGNPSCVMYRASVVRSRGDKFFPEDRTNFDLDIAMRLLREGDLGFVHQVLTFLRYQPGSIMERLSDFNHWFLSVYIAIQEYGPEYLTPEEFQVRSAQATADFYQGMAQVWLKERLLRKRRPDFWAFQEKWIGALGLRIEPKLLARGVAQVALKTLGSPYEVVGKLRQKLAT